MESLAPDGGQHGLEPSSDGRLPPAPTPLLGRSSELDQARSRFTESSCRLLTITGPGGIGKTRFAVRLAELMAAGMEIPPVFVDLSAISDWRLVLPRIGFALGVRESTQRSVPLGIQAHLAGRSLLIVLDNVEHVLQAAADISRLLANVQSLAIIATSRESLRIQWEHEFPLSPLELPRDALGLRNLDTLRHVPAVELLVQRARATRPDFELTVDNAPDIVELCKRLDGLPLALEIAGARMKMLTPGTLLDRLNNRLDVLTRSAPDVPARHQTLQAAIQWSLDLLTQSERKLFARLSVFAGGFDEHAAQFVIHLVEPDACDRLSTDLESLVEKSLLSVGVGANDEPRYRMLETILEFARAQVPPDEQDELNNTHALWTCATVAEIESNIWSSNQKLWRAHLLAEQHNTSAAVKWCLSSARFDMAARIIGHTLFPWWTAGLLREVQRWCRELVDTGKASSHSGPPPDLAVAHFGLGFAALEQGLLPMHAKT